MFYRTLLSLSLRQTLLLSFDNLIERKLKLAQVEYKHLVRGDTPVPMQSAAKPDSNRHECKQLAHKGKMEGQEGDRGVRGDSESCQKNKGGAY